MSKEIHSNTVIWQSDDVDNQDVDVDMNHFQKC